MADTNADIQYITFNTNANLSNEINQNIGTPSATPVNNDFVINVKFYMYF